MKNEVIPWSELVKLSHGEPVEIERVRIKRTGIAVEGRFELPALVQIPDEDQVFISAFLRSHGSIKEMERLFGISYPTVKARLTRIAEQMPFVETIENSESNENPPKSSYTERDILDQLDEGKIDSSEAVKLLRKKRGEK